MKLKPTPIRTAFIFTILYGLIVAIVVASDIRSNVSSILLAPIFILMLLNCKGMGCGFPFGGGGGQYIPSVLLYIILFAVVFLFFWAIIKIIFLIVIKLSN